MAQATLNTPVTGTGGGSSSPSLSINTNDYAGSNRALVCGIMSVDGDNHSQNAPDWNTSETMTEIADANAIGTCSALFYLTGFTEGTYDIDFSGTVTMDNYVMWATVMTDVDLSSGAQDSDTNTGTGTFPTITLATPNSVDDLLIDCLCVEGSSLTLTPGGLQTEVFQDDSTTSGYNASGALSEQDGVSGGGMSYSKPGSTQYSYCAATFSGATASPELEQEGYRFRDDDGSESAATWRQNQDTVDTADIGEKIRLRVLINGSEDTDATQYELQYREKSASGGWRSVKE